VGGSTAPSATTTYTVSFTTENAVPAGAFSAFQWAMNLSGGSNNLSDSVQNTLQLTYSLPEVPTPGTVNVSFNNGTTTTTLTMGNSQSVDTAVNLVSLASTSGVASATAGSLADGTYTVTLSYQDYLGNPMSTDVSSNVIIDTTAPVITAINSSILFPPGAAITWTTNEASSSRVEYGLTT
jgi:hypothetical protein